MKILSIDDDATALLLERHCRAILGHRLEHFASAGAWAQAGRLLAAINFDAVLLEPALGGGDGMRFLAATDGATFQTIIVSARADLALPAFEFGALDFVPKPVSRERLAKALCRIPAAAGGAGGPAQFLAVRRYGHINLVPIDTLLYVEGSDKYSELVLANGQRNFYDKCLGRLEAVLPRSFVRIHKSYLVRFTMVSRLIVQRGSRYFAELKNGERLPVGRSRYAQVKSHLL